MDRILLRVISPMRILTIRMLLYHVYCFALTSKLVHVPTRNSCVLCKASSRREFINWTATIAISTEACAMEPESTGGLINLPLENCGGSWCTLFSIDNEVFRGVLDTGSPFLTVAGSCTRRWGCFSGQGIQSGLSDTIEIYAGNYGPVSWRKGMLEMGFLRDDLDDEDFIFSKVIFGVLSDVLVSRPGGVFLGLIKYKSPKIRPTFLGQTNISSIRFNFKDRVLSLSRHDLISRSNSDAIRLVDLRMYGDSVMHYSAEVAQLSSEQQILFPTRTSLNFLKPKKVFVIFDTGTTGMAVSRELFEEENRSARLNKSHPFRDVSLVIQTLGGNKKQLFARRPLTTPIDIPWPGFNEKAHLIVAGLEFMKDITMTIDADQMLLLWE